ncbi:MBL fold metallo-hydrolase [Streptomyces sp. NPDC049954]|uniref:MBL fold metallo-hydrolase n=1 Tax=Streptomyces sp. NPDC049954 TaxID=3155779 RepID=UPI00343FCA99
MPTLALAPGVTQIPLGSRVNVFAVAGDDGLTLVDAGMGRKAPGQVLDALAGLGHRPSDVRRIVLTHAHPDHVQAVPELRRATGAKVLIHEGDAGWLPVGRVPAGQRSTRAGSLLDRLPLVHWTPFEADGLLADGAVIEGSGGLRVLHTPGHTPGHVVLFHEPGRTALVGDAVFHRGALSYGPEAMAADPARRPAGAARVPAETAVVGFSHGTAITGSTGGTGGTGIEEFHTFLGRR